MENLFLGWLVFFEFEQVQMLFDTLALYPILTDKNSNLFAASMTTAVLLSACRKFDRGYNTVLNAAYEFEFTAVIALPSSS